MHSRSRDPSLEEASHGLGRGGSMHIFDPESGNLGTNGIVGGGVPLATGLPQFAASPGVVVAGS